jgi:hypothetical protein
MYGTQMLFQLKNTAGNSIFLGHRALTLINAETDQFLPITLRLLENLRALLRSEMLEASKR